MERTYRKDIGSGKRYPQRELIRVVIAKTKISKVDWKFNLAGRGIYIHQDSLEKVLKKRILERELHRKRASIDAVNELELFLKEENINGKENK